MFLNKGGGGGGAGGGGGGFRDKCAFIFDACDQDQDGFLNVRELQLLVSLSSNGATSMNDATTVALMAHLGADPLRGLEKQHLERAYERKVTSSSIHDDFATIKATVNADAAFAAAVPGGVRSAKQILADQVRQLGMFQEDQIHHAVKRHSSVEACVEWLLSNADQGKGPGGGDGPGDGGEGKGDDGKDDGGVPFPRLLRTESANKGKAWKVEREVLDTGGWRRVIMDPGLDSEDSQDLDHYSKAGFRTLMSNCPPAPCPPPILPFPA